MHVSPLWKIKAIALFKAHFPFISEMKFLENSPLIQLNKWTLYLEDDAVIGITVID